MRRRDFLRGALGAVAGGALLPRPALGAWPPVWRAGSLGPIGIQLYTVRGAMAHDVEGTLATIARIGYREVEFAGLFNHPAAAVRRMLDRHGLVAPSSHVGLPDDLDRDWPAMLHDARTLGQSYIICPSLPSSDWSPEGMKRIAGRFNAAGAMARRAGLQFGFHNHADEFRPVGGQVPYDTLLAACDPALVTFEIDLYWMVTGGRDPLTYLAKYPGRFPMVHAKDRTADGRMTDVGSGVIDFPKILAAFERGGLKHCFVEHDDPPDPFASARASFAYLNRLTF